MCVQFDFLSMTVFGEIIPALPAGCRHVEPRWSSTAMNMWT